MEASSSHRRARNGVLYAGEVGIAGDEGDELPRIETVLKSGQPILVQVTKDPMRSKGARLTALVSLAGRHLVLVPNGRSLGVSRRLPDNERARLRDIAQRLRPDDHADGARPRGASPGPRATISPASRSGEVKAKSEKAKAAPPLIYTDRNWSCGNQRPLHPRNSKCYVEARTSGQAALLSAPDDSDLDHGELYRERLRSSEFRVAEKIRKSLGRKVWLPPADTSS